MALFYKGVGPGSYWHLNDPYHHGFTPRCPGATPSTDRLIEHIRNGTNTTPYISLTRSYAVARSYALVGPRGFATPRTPGFIFELEFSTDKPHIMLDPLKVLAKDLPEPWVDPHYHHTGDQSFLLGVIDPIGMRTHLRRQIAMPPGSGATPQTPSLSRELEAMVRALRDAEVIVCGSIPRSFIAHRHEAY